MEDILKTIIDKSIGELLIPILKGQTEEIQILNKSNSNSIELLIKDIEFRGSTSNLNVKSKNNKNYLKIQNISSNISNNFQQGNSINLEFNTALGTIFKNETSS